MNELKSRSYKIVGKIELTKDQDEKLNTYYLIQWQDQSETTIENRVSLYVCFYIFVKFKWLFFRMVKIE